MLLHLFNFLWRAVIMSKAEIARIIREHGGRDYDVERLEGTLRAPSTLKEGVPVFTVEITLNRRFGTLVQKLKRGDRSETAPPGKYLCFPAWDWNGPLLPEERTEVTVSRALLEQVLEAFSTGYVHDETREGLRSALAK